jgi:hypothetical protein
MGQGGTVWIIFSFLSGDLSNTKAIAFLKKHILFLKL